MSGPFETILSVSGGLPRPKFCMMQVRILLLILLLYVIDGIDTQVLSVAVSSLAHDWGLPLSSFGTAMAAGYAGSAAGALVGGFLGDRFGRKPVVIGGSVLFGLATIAMVFLRTPNEVAVMRLIAGLGLGGCLPPGLALLTETMPKSRHGLAISLAMLCHPLGISLTGLAAVTILPTFGWKTLFLLAGLLPIAAATILLLTLPESPAYLARFPARAKQLQYILNRLEMSLPEPHRDTKTAVKQNRLALLLAPGERAKVIALLMAFFFAYLAMTMVLSWLPALLSSVGYSQEVAGTALFVWSIAGIGGIFFAGLLTGRFGIDKVVQGHVLGAILALAAVTITLPTVVHGAPAPSFYILIALGGYMLNGTMTSLYALATASFASIIRASGVGLAATLGRAGAIVGALAGAQALGLLGTKGFFSIVTLSALLTLVALLLGKKARL